MRAYVLEDFGVEPRMAHVPLPDIGDEDVLVRVLASSVNPHESHVISGAARTYMEYRFPVTLGSDVSGIVEEVGRSVTRFMPGDKVFGALRGRVAHRGTFADYAALPADCLVLQPSGLDNIDAGTLGLASLTAVACVEALGASAGHTVLIVGASGGVGSVAIQLLASVGAKVIATARGREGAKYVRSLGAVETVERADDVASVVRLAHPDGIDGVLDLVLSDSQRLTRLASNVLSIGGSVVSTLRAADPEALTGARTTNVVATANPVALQHIADLVGAGCLRPSVSKVFDFEEITEAISAQQSGVLGKVAVRIAPRGEE
ncbi:MAG: NADPH:quinone reductase [Microbacteriaceae bacterium]|nr:NADPH:quinone reductase [Microbacteriaceae bacterium]